MRQFHFSTFYNIFSTLNQPLLFILKKILISFTTIFSLFVLVFSKTLIPFFENFLKSSFVSFDNIQQINLLIFLNMRKKKKKGIFRIAHLLKICFIRESKNALRLLYLISSFYTLQNFEFLPPCLSSFLKLLYFSSFSSDVLQLQRLNEYHAIGLTIGLSFFACLAFLHLLAQAISLENLTAPRSSLLRSELSRSSQG